MGQQTIGVLYGAKCPSGVELYDDDSDDGGLIEAFDAERDERGDGLRGQDAIQFGIDENMDVVGAWAIGSLRWVEPSLKAVDLKSTAAWLASIASSEQGQEAIRLWDRFAKFAKARGVKFDPPTWWLAEHEVA